MLRPALWLCVFMQAGTSEAAQIFAGPDSYGRLGSGLETLTQQWRPSCLDGRIESSVANRSIAMRMYVSQSASEILDDQRGYGSALVDFWVLGAKARSEFILRNSESSTQSSLMWSVDYRGASVVFHDRQLNVRGLTALTRSPAERRQLCGDQFIIGAALGARFYLAASLVFDSETKYRYFKTRVSASAFGGLLKKDKTSIDEVRRMAQGAYLSIQAFQYGGETFALDLLSASQKSYCSMDHIEPCLDRFSALHRYAFGADGFQKHAAPQKPEQLAVLWLQASPYPDAGHFLSEYHPPTAADPDFVQLSEQLFQWNSAVQQNINQIRARFTEASLEPSEKKLAQEQLMALESKAESIREAAALCSDQENYEACQRRLDSINTMVVSP